MSIVFQSKLAETGSLYVNMKTVFIFKNGLAFNSTLTFRTKSLKQYFLQYICYSRHPNENQGQSAAGRQK